VTEGKESDLLHKRSHFSNGGGQYAPPASVAMPFRAASVELNRIAVPDWVMHVQHGKPPLALHDPGRLVISV